jgi:uncharacterized protein YdaU (DUF1376 family)
MLLPEGRGLIPKSMQAPSKLPWFKFFPVDWIALVASEQLSVAAEGCYIRLVSHCWVNGSIPRDRATLARICGIDSPDLDQVIAMFMPLGSDTSRLYSPAVEAEREDCSKRHLRQSQAGKAAMKKRWSKIHKLTPQDLASQ